MAGWQRAPAAPHHRTARGPRRARPRTVTGRQPARLAGRYRLDSVIGKGSMGTVWAATDEVLHRQVAIKEIDFPVGTPAAERAQLEHRTLREARAIAALSNPYVITLFDILTLDNGPVIVMELLHARSLAEILRKVGRLPDGQAATIGVAVASGLLAAHAAGITHRDVKPGNVLICDDGRIKLTDFGIARSSGDQTMTATGLLLGSPAYIAPGGGQRRSGRTGLGRLESGRPAVRQRRGPAAVRPGHRDRHADLGGQGPGAAAPAFRPARRRGVRAAGQDPEPADADRPGADDHARHRRRPVRHQPGGRRQDPAGRRGCTPPGAGVIRRAVGAPGRHGRRSSADPGGQPASTAPGAPAACHRPAAGHQPGRRLHPPARRPGIGPIGTRITVSQAPAGTRRGRAASRVRHRIRAGSRRPPDSARPTTAASRPAGQLRHPASRPGQLPDAAASRARTPATNRFAAIPRPVRGTVGAGERCHHRRGPSRIRRPWPRCQWPRPTNPRSAADSRGCLVALVAAVLGFFGVRIIADLATEDAAAPPSPRPASRCRRAALLIRRAGPISRRATPDHAADPTRTVGSPRARATTLPACQSTPRPKPEPRPKRPPPRWPARPGCCTTTSRW